MKKILIVAATELELKPFLSKIADKFIIKGTNLYQNDYINLHILSTGVGAIATCYQLSRLLAKARFDMVINMGLAGTADYDCELGQVVNVVEDSFGDIGASDKEGNFIDIFGLNLANPAQFPFNKGLIKAENQGLFADLPQVKASTFNTVSGTAQEVEKFNARYPQHLQSMEGAAFFYVCALENVPIFAQIRAVSNYIEIRDKSRWKIGQALENLALYLAHIILKI